MAVVIGSPATAKVIPDLSRSAPMAAVGRGTSGWSDPRRGWVLEHLQPQRSREVDDRGGLDGSDHGRHPGHLVVGGGDDQQIDPGCGRRRPAGGDRVRPSTRSPPRRRALPSGTGRPGPARLHGMWSRDPFRRSSPRRVPFASENLGASAHSVPTTATSPPASATASASTRSGASSASGARTNRRSRQRGWGTVSSGLVEGRRRRSTARRRRGSVGPHRAARTRPAAASSRRHSSSSR